MYLDMGSFIKRNQYNILFLFSSSNFWVEKKKLKLNDDAAPSVFSFTKPQVKKRKF